MPAPAPEWLPPSVSRHADWKQLPDGNYQSGNIQIRLVEVYFSGDYRHESWGLWIKDNGRWKQCYCKSRPYWYGSVGQARIGVALTGNLIIGNPKAKAKQ